MTSIIALLLLLIDTSYGKSCVRCGLKVECWENAEAEGLEDGQLKYKEMDKLDGCARAEVQCQSGMDGTVNFLKLGEFITLRPVVLTCDNEGKWAPYGSEGVACAVSGAIPDSRKPPTPTCFSTSEVIFDGSDTGDEQLEQQGDDCRSCPINVECTKSAAYKDGVIEWRMEKEQKTGCAILEAECTFGPDATGNDDDVAQLFIGDYPFDKKVRLKCGPKGTWVPSVNNAISCGVFRANGNYPPQLQEQATCTLPRPIRVPGQEVFETTTTVVTTTTTTIPTTTPTPLGCCAQWSEWVEMTRCADTCGSCGLQRMRRRCLTEKTCPCEGEKEEVRHCNKPPCRIPRTSCCSPFRPHVQGKKILCVTENQKSKILSGISQPNYQCDKPNCCPLNGVWSEWQPFGKCSAACGGFGTSQRKRICLSEADHGCKCKGPQRDAGPCNLQPCSKPGWSNCRNGMVPKVRGFSSVCSEAKPKIEKTDCCPEGGLWDEWSEWTHCSKPCGGCGRSKRWRECASDKVGCPCRGHDKEEERCNNVVCETQPYCCEPLEVAVYAGNVLCWRRERTLPETPNPVAHSEFFTLSVVDYAQRVKVSRTELSTGYGAWSDWHGYCTASCGLCGHYVRERTCMGGKECSGNYREELPNSCPKLACSPPKAPCCHGIPTKVRGEVICVKSKAP